MVAGSTRVIGPSEIDSGMGQDRLVEYRSDRGQWGDRCNPHPEDLSMAERLKRWESPRRKGRNDKGRGGSARQRQRQKQLKMLKNKLKDKPQNNPKNNESDPPREGSRQPTLPSLALAA